MKVKVQIGKPDKPGTSITAVFEIEPAERISYSNATIHSTADKRKRVLPEYPELTYMAVDAAFVSGVFYAKHGVAPKTYEANLISFHAQGEVENAIPFAVAVKIAIYEVIGGSHRATNEDNSGWEIMAVERL